MRRWTILVVVLALVAVILTDTASAGRRYRGGGWYGGYNGGCVDASVPTRRDNGSVSGDSGYSGAWTVGYRGTGGNGGDANAGSVSEGYGNGGYVNGTPAWTAGYRGIGDSGGGYYYPGWGRGWQGWGG